MVAVLETVEYRAELSKQQTGSFFPGPTAVTACGPVTMRSAGSSAFVPLRVADRRAGARMRRAVAEKM